MPRVLHVLAQRPSRTGSGITLEELARHAAREGWEQWAVVGTPADDPCPSISGIPNERIMPLRFGEGALDFALPGMSDVMPYASTPYAQLTPAQLERYRAAWRAHLERAIALARPQVIHAHHLWIVASLLEEVAPEIPKVLHCHATGLRQLTLCPHLSEEIRAGNSGHDRYCVLHGGHAEALVETLDVPRERIAVVGAGFNAERFSFDPKARRHAQRLLYVGKHSGAKGLPSLLDAISRLRPRFPQLELHVAGGGQGEDAAALQARMEAMPEVIDHGMLAPDDLVPLMRSSAACVLPSFYEGVPLVLVEAFACGCRLVSTALPGVVEQIATHAGDGLELVEMPRLEGADRPVEAELPAFVERLCAAIEETLTRPPMGDPRQAYPGACEALSWHAVFERVQRQWLSLL